MEAFRLMKELKLNLEQEILYLPKESGLKLIESSPEVNQPNRPGLYSHQVNAFKPKYGDQNVLFNLVNHIFVQLALYIT